MTDLEFENQLMEWAHAHAAKEAEAWIRAARQRTMTSPTVASLQALREVATQLAQAASPATERTDKLTWAGVAVQAAEMIGELSPLSDSALVAGMALRSLMIEEFGVVVGDAILDPQHVLDQFFRRLDFSPDDIISWCRTLRTTDKITPDDLEHLTRIRLIKQLVSILKSLVDQKHIVTDDRLLPWLSLHGQLI